MNSLEVLYNSIKDNKITSYNHITTKGLGICFNILEIPHAHDDTGFDTAAITISVMKDRKRKNCMEAKSFARLMHMIEDNLSSYLSYEGFPYFSSLVGKIPNRWYSSLNCHRVFLVPLTSASEVMTGLLSRENIASMNALGVNEVSLVVSTREHDLYAQFFGD